MHQPAGQPRECECCEQGGQTAEPAGIAGKGRLTQGGKRLKMIAKLFEHVCHAPVGGAAPANPAGGCKMA
ncbi:hypothetical protein GCM10011505_30380 [Tistrella bauzanensis]|uniref:Uncharacterized protein n=1 Tax=Tistrella bauzanensis TaxID=657419 RepID=A0ABQ1IQ25_9PROT|nr:hypothetical protein GCM10011505_30380 [Tistrella bauzanensis]